MEKEMSSPPKKLTNKQSCCMIGSILLIVAILVVALSVGYFIRSIGRGINDAYATWGAAEMVIDYMENHNGKWPRSWDDLKEQFEAGQGGVGGWSYEKYQGRVVIDFEADPEELRRLSMENPQATFNVIRPQDDTGIYFDGREPNQMLYDYFRSKEQAEETQKGDTTP